MQSVPVANDSRPLRVVIAGAGVAGLETMLALNDLAADKVDVRLLSARRRFVYRPLLVAEPFGLAAPIELDVDTIVADAGAAHVSSDLREVDPARRLVHTSDGDQLEYDALLIATGARPVEAIPGALTFGLAGPDRFAAVLRELGHRGVRRAAFVVPPGVTWTLAAYELALLTAAELRARAVPGVELSVVTPEAAPLEVFGEAAAGLVGERLEASGIALLTSARAQGFAADALALEGGNSLAADRVIALPALEVPPMPGLPQRDRGFVITDADMNVFGLDRVWAAGDVTSFPVKQGGLATQQADVAARSIAARAGASVGVHPFQPTLRAAVITGEAPEFLRTRLGVGDGEASVGRALWWPPVKLAGDYLAPYLAEDAEPLDRHLLDFDAPADPREGEEEYDAAVRLLLAAAEADAAAEDFEAALGWLELVERMELTLPSAYVARREEWRRAVEPQAKIHAAGARIDPSFVDAASAISDLERRIGWLRAAERRGEAEMRADLDHFDRALEHLISLSRGTGTYGPRGDD